MGSRPRGRFVYGVMPDILRRRIGETRERLQELQALQHHGMH